MKREVKMEERNEKQKFSRAFWVANIVELLERAAFYGVFIVITLYLSRILGFTDSQAGVLSGVFTAGLYFLPPFSGALADKIGFKSSLVLAFGLLAVGYFGLGLLPTMLESAGLVTYGVDTVFHDGYFESNGQWYIVPIIIILMIGGSFIKAVITGTVAKETNEANRARGFSIFYAMVNIGAFSGKTVVKPLREAMGNEGLITLNYFSAALTFIALVAVYFLYKSSKTAGEGKSLKEVWNSLVRISMNARLMILILIVTGFWMVQQQMYATMPKYVLRLAGEGASPEWYANVNPFIVILTVGFVTQMMRRKTALFSMTVGMFIMPFSAFVMAQGNLMGTAEVDLGIVSMHPIALMMVLGIVLQGLAESFISPRFLEFFSLQAPKGEEGLYLGFSHLHSFIAALAGFIISGNLLEKYCPDPKLYSSREEWAVAAQDAHHIWYFFTIVAVVSAVSLVIYGRVIRHLDKKKVSENVA